MKALSFFSYVLLLLFTLFVKTKTEKVLSRFCKNQYDCGELSGYTCGQNRTCVCDTSYAVKDDKCVGGVGQQCRYDEHCIEGAFCEFQKMCQCKEQLYPSEDGLSCSRSKQTVSHKPHFYIIELFLIYFLKII